MKEVKDEVEVKAACLANPELTFRYGESDELELFHQVRGGATDLKAFCVAAMSGISASARRTPN